MKITFEEVVKEFYETYKESDLKGYTYIEILNLVKSPFKYLKKSIMDGLLLDFRFKYLGVFRVREFQVRKKIEIYKKIYQNEFDKGEDAKVYKLDRFKEIYETMEKYIDKIEKDGTSTKK